MLSARRLASSWTITSRSAASGIRRRMTSAVRLARSHAKPASSRAQIPTLALPPLSPERAPKCSPRTVPGAMSAGATSIVERLDRLGRRRSGRRRGDVDPGPVGGHDDLVDLVGRHERRPVDAERGGRPGRGRREVARVAGEGELDGSRRERPPDRPLVGGADLHRERAAGLLLVGAVAGGRCEPGAHRDAGVAQRIGAAHRGDQRLLGPARLGLLVQAGEDERHLVAEATLVVDGHLRRRRRRLAAHTGDAHAVRADLVEADRVEAGDDVGVGVGRRLDLVEQLGGDGVDGQRAAGAGVLRDDARAVGGDLGDREAERPRRWRRRARRRTRSCRRSSGRRTR